MSASVFLPTGRPLLFFLGVSVTLSALLAAASYLERRGLPAIGWVPRWLATAALLPSVATLAMILRVFVWGGSSNVAQMAAGGGEELWSLWYGAWGPLSGTALLGVLLALAALACPPYRSRWVTAWAFPLSALTSALLSIRMLVALVPDA